MAGLSGLSGLSIAVFLFSLPLYLVLLFLFFSSFLLFTLVIPFPSLSLPTPSYTHFQSWLLLLSSVEPLGKYSPSKSPSPILLDIDHSSRLISIRASNPIQE